MDAPIRSGVGWIDFVFDQCVRLLVWLARMCGVSYNEINAWIFCVTWPTITVILIGLVIWQRNKIRKMNRDLNKL
jgi:hypothetical protein